MDADVAARFDQLQELLEDGFSRVGERFTAIEQRVVGVDQRFDQLHTEMIERFIGMDERLKTLDKRVSQLETRMAAFEERLQHLEGGLTALRSELKQELGAIQTRLAAYWLAAVTPGEAGAVGSSPRGRLRDMSVQRITRRSGKARRKGRTDWARVECLSDEQAAAGAATDDENPLWTSEQLKSAELVLPSGEPKVPISIRLDREVLDYDHLQCRIPGPFQE